MIRTGIAMVAAAVLAAMLPADAMAQAKPEDPAAVAAYIDTLQSLYGEGTVIADPAAVAAYIDTLESLYIEAAVIAERVFDRYRAVDAFRRGDAGEDQLARAFGPSSDTIHADIDAHFQRLKQNAKPVMTDDLQRNRNTLAFQLSIAGMTDLSRAVVTLTGKLRAAALADDAAAYERIEANVFETWSALYSSRYNHFAALLFEIDRDDPRYGIHRAGSGIAEAGVTTYKVLADSLRDDAFDVAAYETAIDASLRLIEKGLSAAGAALADPTWPPAAPDESAAARAARRERETALAERYANGARATAAAIRRDVGSLRTGMGGSAVLSGVEMRDALHTLRRDIDRTLSDAVELDPVRREFDRLGRAGGAR